MLSFSCSLCYLAMQVVGFFASQNVQLLFAPETKFQAPLLGAIQINISKPEQINQNYVLLGMAEQLFL